MASQYWKLPLNWQELIDAVGWAARGDLLFEANAPLTVTANVVVQKASRSFIVHLINYDAERNPNVKDIQVWLRIPNQEKIRHISVFSPDATAVQSLRPVSEVGKVGFMLPGLQTYCLVEVR